MDNAPEISGVSVKFMQDGNTLGTTGDYEDITINLEFQAGEEDGPFIVIKTDGWSIDNISDIEDLVDRVNQVLVRK